MRGETTILHDVSLQANQGELIAILGPKHRDLLWAAALLGAIVTLLADLAARTLLSPAELPLGVLTALIGAPFFLWLLRKMRSGESSWT